MKNKKQETILVDRLLDEKVTYAECEQEVIDEKFMSSVKGYLETRHLDVRGIWYDRGHGERAHANLHIVSPLPLHYFRTLFIMWNMRIGSAWIQNMYNPVIWRLYGSRNHNMFGTKRHDYKKEERFNEHFQEGSIIFHMFKKYMLEQNIIPGKDLVYKREEHEKIFNYELYKVGEEEMVSMFEKIHL